jgi:hypothetical protein
MTARGRADAAYAGGRALKGLNIAGVVVGLDFESAGPAVADVDDAGVLAGALDDASAFGGQALEVDAAGFVGAVLAPHYAVDAQLCEGWHAAEGGQDAAVLVRGNAVRGEQLRSNGSWLGNDRRGSRSHHGCLHCRTGFRGALQNADVESRD